MRGRTEDQDLVRLMMKMKKVTSPFELLSLEKQRVKLTYDKLVHMKNTVKDPLLSATANSNQVKPLLTWKLSNLNLKQNFYKESDPFFVEGTQWILTISKMNDKECTVGLKYASSLDHEYDSIAGMKQMAKLMYERYSVLSLLNWVRVESEPALKHQS